MNKFVNTFLGLFVCTSLMYCQSGQTKVLQQLEQNQEVIKKIAELESYCGIKIFDEGPAGSKHTNEKRGEFGCTKMRITVYNDTIVPIELKVIFPSEQVASLPDPTAKVQYWILPEVLTPDTFQRAANFGIIGLEEHFNSDFTESRIIKTEIQPKEYYTFYLAGMGESPFKYGSSYPKLFINGQDVDTPYLQGKSIEAEHTDSSSLDLVFGVGHTPHNLYTLIPCGEIKFLK